MEFNECDKTGPDGYKTLLRTDVAAFNERHAQWREHNDRPLDLFVADLQGLNLQGADLRGAYLEGANFQNADIRGALFQGAKLRAARFQGAKLENTQFTDADILGAQFDEGVITVVGSSMSEKTLPNAASNGRHNGRAAQPILPSSQEIRPETVLANTNQRLQGHGPADNR